MGNFANTYIGNFVKSAIPNCLPFFVGGKDVGAPIQVGVLRPGGVAAKLVLTVNYIHTHIS